MSETTHPVDVEVGKAIRYQRMIKGISQTELGSGIGVTFQQVQKYENGKNRVSASKLVAIAHALDVEIGLFFANASMNNVHASKAETDTFPASLSATRAGVQLYSAFFSIKDERMRRKILGLVQAIAESGSANLSDILLLGDDQ